MQWKNQLKKKYHDNPPSYQRVWFELNQIFNHGEDYIIFFAPGFTQRPSVHRYLDRDTPGCYYGALSAAMGSAGEAIGIQLAAKRRVICVLGDFEAHVAQLPTLLWTCTHHNIPVIWIVIDNATGATVKRAFWRYDQYMHDHKTFVGIDLNKPRTNWVKIAEANGVRALHCEHSEKLSTCIEQAISITTPVLLSMRTQPFEEPLNGL
jgi:thiamine pyrophosphate-dependent acetolactate synthase large subunit-like protein